MAIALLNPPHFSIWCIWSDSTLFRNATEAAMAETERFELSVGLPPRFLSRELVSATHPRLRIAVASAAL